MLTDTSQVLTSTMAEADTVGTFKIFGEEHSLRSSLKREWRGCIQIFLKFEKYDEYRKVEGSMLTTRFLPRAPCHLYETKIKFNLFGNEVYYTNSLTLLVKNMLCSKVRCQKAFNLILISYEIRDTRHGR